MHAVLVPQFDLGAAGIPESLLLIVDITARTDADLFKSGNLSVYASATSSGFNDVANLCEDGVTPTVLGETMRVLCPGRAGTRFITIVRGMLVWRLALQEVVVTRSGEMRGEGLRERHVPRCACLCACVCACMCL